MKSKAALDNKQNNMNAVIETRGLNYHYSRKVQTLSDIELDVEKGSVYGFLGPNGSGKTTTLRLLLGLLNNQQGEIRVFGKPLQADRITILRRIGSLIEQPSLYGHLSARQNLEIYRATYGATQNRLQEVLRIADLQDAGTKPVKRFSLGMKQRLSIALALLPDPELLVLDEPTNGLDPAGIIELRQLIRKLNKERGMTIIVSSHLLGEVEKMVSHVGIIVKGRLLFQGPLQHLHEVRQSKTKLILETSDNNAALHLLKNYRPLIIDQQVVLPYTDREQVADVARILGQHSLDLYLLQPKKPELEQLFIDLTSGKL